MKGTTARIRREFASLVHAVEISSPVIDRAACMAVKHGLKGYDAIQLAVAQTVDGWCRAMELGPITVVSADKQLSAATLAEGLDLLDLLK